MTTSLTVRIDSDLKREAEELFSDLGLNLTSAITCFFRKAVASESIPFSLSRSAPNRTTLSAMREAERIACDSGTPGYSTRESLIEALES